MGYSIQTKPNDAKVYGSNLRVSRKDALVVTRRIKGMKLNKAKNFLEKVIEGNLTLDGKKHHVNASAAVLNLLKSAEANAEDMGLDKKRLYVLHASAYKGRKIFRPTRIRFKKGAWRMKNTNMEIVLRESKNKK